MNFLAHMYLSCGNDDMLIGNYIADFVRNRDLVLHSKEVVQGVRLHRHIDSYTDTHVEVVKGTRLLRKDHGKYAPVVIDVCYDYILSKNWNRYSGESLREFADRVYGVITRYEEELPPYLQDIAPKMIADDFLLQYGTEAGLRKTFERIGKRAKYGGGWSMAFDSLLLHYDALEEGFNRFFPEMIASVDAHCNC